MTQVALARRAGVSLSLLSKIEVGGRALTPAVAAAVARALHISLGTLYEEAEISPEQSTLLADPRTAVRRYDIPDQAPEPDPAQLRIEVDQATTHAHAAASQPGWALLADVYSVVYWLAARYRWMNLVEVAPTRQAWAASQQPNPLVAAVAARDRAGTFLNCGDFAGGLTVVDRAIVAA